MDANDVADVCVAALVDEGHAGQVYELTGPRLLTFRDVVDEIGRAAGRQIEFVPITHDEFAVGLTEAGVSPDEVGLVSYLFATVLDGRNSHLGDGVEQALGRSARVFADYVAETAATGVWNTQ